MKWPYENGKWPLTKGINKVTLNSLFFVVVFLSGLLQAISLCSWWSLQVGVPCGPWCIVPTRLNSKKRIGGIMCFMPKLHRHFAEFKLITYGALMARDRNRCCLSNFYRFFFMKWSIYQVLVLPKLFNSNLSCEEVFWISNFSCTICVALSLIQIQIDVWNITSQNYLKLIH